MMNYIDELDKLVTLKRAGAISEAEFESLADKLRAERDEAEGKEPAPQKRRVIAPGETISKEEADEVAGFNLRNEKPLVLIEFLILALVLTYALFNLGLVAGLIVASIGIIIYLWFRNKLLQMFPNRIMHYIISILFLSTGVYFIIEQRGFSSKVVQMERRFESDADGYCDCVSDARKKNNRDRQGEEYLRCINRYVLTWGEVSQSIKNADLNSEDERRVRNAYDKYTAQMDNCKLR